MDQWTYIKLNLLRTFRRYRTGVLFLLPALILFTYFSWIPILKGFLISFQQYNIVGDSPYVGLRNFEKLLGRQQRRDVVSPATLGDGLRGALKLSRGSPTATNAEPHRRPSPRR